MRQLLASLVFVPALFMQTDTSIQVQVTDYSYDASGTPTAVTTNLGSTYVSQPDGSSASTITLNGTTYENDSGPLPTPAPANG